MMTHCIMGGCMELGNYIEPPVRCTLDGVGAVRKVGSPCDLWHVMLATNQNSYAWVPPRCVWVSPRKRHLQSSTDRWGMSSTV